MGQLGRLLTYLRPYRGRVLLALALSFVAAMFIVPSALVTGIALIALRMIAGTVGAALSRFDVPVVVDLGAGRNWDEAH